MKLSLHKIFLRFYCNTVMNKTQLIIDKAKSILQKNPYDLAHGLLHHKNVWKNVRWIIKLEGLANIDAKSLQIAAWWHDVDRGSSDHPRMTKTLVDLSYPEAKIKTIIDIINHHSYEHEQPTLESKVLFDADKLEYISIVRWKEFVRMMMQGRVPIDALEVYKRYAAQRIPNVYKRLYFTCTIERLFKEFPRYQRWAKIIALKVNL